MLNRRTLRIGISVLSVAAALGQAPLARAQTQYDRDYATLQLVVGFARDGLNFVSGTTSAIAWLTGINNPAPGPTIEQFRGVIDSALMRSDLNHLTDRVKGLITIFNDARNDAASIALSMMNTGSDPEAVMQTSWARDYLANNMSTLVTETAFVRAALEGILETPTDYRSAGYEREKTSVAALPLYMTIVSLRASALKMVAELAPALAPAQNSNIDNTLRAAVSTLYKSVGAYSISFPDPFNPWNWFPVLSPVGQQQSLMFKRQIYAYYHRFTNGTLNTYPALRFSQYQTIPLVDAALTFLDESKNALFQRNYGLAYVSQSHAWVPDLYSDPNNPHSGTKFADVPSAIVHLVRACFIDDAACPHIAGQPN